MNHPPVAGKEKHAWKETREREQYALLRLDVVLVRDDGEERIFFPAMKQKGYAS